MAARAALRDVREEGGPGDPLVVTRTPTAFPSSSSSQDHDAKGGNGPGDKSRITADEDMIAGEICLPRSTG